MDQAEKSIENGQPSIYYFYCLSKYTSLALFAFIVYNTFPTLYIVRAEGPGVARGKKNLEEKNISIFLAINTTRSTVQCPQKNFSPIGPAV